MSIFWGKLQVGVKGAQREKCTAKEVKNASMYGLGTQEYSRSCLVLRVQLSLSFPASSHHLIVERALRLLGLLGHALSDEHAPKPTWLSVQTARSQQGCRCIILDRACARMRVSSARARRARAATRTRFVVAVSGATYACVAHTNALGGVGIGDVNDQDLSRRRWRRCVAGRGRTPYGHR